MNFIFNCPLTQKTFETDAFQVIDDEGVEKGPSGEQVWTARIRLLDPCPFCGAVHTYQPEELSCPFSVES